MRILNYISVVVGVLFVTMVTALAFMMLYPFKVLEVSKVETLTPVVKLGDNFEMKVKYCKYGHAEASVSRTFFNDRAVVLTPYISNLPEGCTEKIITIKVPDNMFPSDYKLVTCNTYRVNPLREITACYSTDTFTLIPADLTLDKHDEDDQDKFEQLFRDHKILMEEYQKIQNALKLR